MKSVHSVSGRVQVTTEGGLDAAYEAPNVYAAMDALAGRARAWAERRQRLLVERGEGGGLAPEEAGRAAAAVIKQVGALRCQHVPSTCIDHVAALGRGGKKLWEL